MESNFQIKVLVMMTNIRITHALNMIKINVNIQAQTKLIKKKQQPDTALIKKNSIFFENFCTFILKSKKNPRSLKINHFVP